MAYAFSFTVDPNFRRILRKAQINGIREQAKVVALEARRLITKQAARERAARTGEKKTGRSLPGGFPRSDTGNYRRSIKYVVKGTAAFVGPSAPKGAHAGILKWGTNRMAPRLVPSEVALQNSENRLVAMFRDKL